MTNPTIDTITTDLIADGLSPIAARAVAGVLIQRNLTLEQMTRQVDTILRDLSSTK